MKKAFIYAAALAIVGGSLTTTSFAQETKPLGLSVRLGMFWPNMDQAKKAGKTWFGGGVEYKLGDLKYPSEGSNMSASYSISADYYQKNDFRHVPILINFIGRSDTMYYFAGAGIGLTREKDKLGNRKNNTGFGYQVGIGYEISKAQAPIFVEAKYVGNSRSEVNGFGVFVGIRF